MTERNVRRGMLVATIGVAGLLTALGVAGLMVVTRGPQAQALPLVRTLITQDSDGTVAAGTLAPTTHPPLPWPPPLQATESTPTTVPWGETAEDGHTGADSRPSLSGSTGRTYITPNVPSPSAPPATSGAVTPPASAAPTSAPPSNVTPRAGGASFAGGDASTDGGSAAVGPALSSTGPVEMKTEDPAVPDNSREVISPKLRVSTADDHDPDDSDDPNDPRR